MSQREEELNETMEQKQGFETADSVLVEDSLQQQLDEKEKQCADYLDRLQRTMAEFDNFRKRTTKEKATMYEDGSRDTIQKILPVIDNLERALGSANQHVEAQGIVQGVQMVLKQFKDILIGLGIEEIQSIGAAFDPNVHYAVSHAEDENYGENEIVEELQKGYIFKGKVIRHSMVKVVN